MNAVEKPAHANSHHLMALFAVQSLPFERPVARTVCVGLERDTALNRTLRLSIRKFPIVAKLSTRLLLGLG